MSGHGKKILELLANFFRERIRRRTRHFGEKQDSRHRRGREDVFPLPSDSWQQQEQKYMGSSRHR